MSDMHDAIAEAKRWYFMRISSMVLALCVLVHIATMVYAIRGGLTAAEIFGRTKGSFLFAGFYGIFVLACAVHVPLGLETIAREWLGIPRKAGRALALGFALLILVMGLRAIYGVVAR